MVEGRPADEAFDVQDMMVDAAAGFAGGAGGHVGAEHLAADVIHMPEEPSLPRPRRHAVGRRKLVSYDKAVDRRQNLQLALTGFGTAVASAPAHGIQWINANFWAYLNWMVMAHQSPPAEPQACVETRDSATGTISRSCN